MLEQIDTDFVLLSPAAADAVRELLQDRRLEGFGLRVFVQGGGCSGVQYGMAFENNFLDSDLTMEAHGIKVVVDDISIGYLRGASIDFVDGPQGKGFLINNPNNISACGCGGGESHSHDSDGCGCGGSCACNN